MNQLDQTLADVRVEQERLDQLNNEIAAVEYFEFTVS